MLRRTHACTCFAHTYTRTQAGEFISTRYTQEDDYPSLYVKLCKQMKQQPARERSLRTTAF
jgi:hypothetical protein